MLSLQRPYAQIFQNSFFCTFWNFSIAGIFWQQIYSHMPILMYRKLASKISKYCQFILQKPYIHRLDFMSKDGHRSCWSPSDIRSWLEQRYAHLCTEGLIFFLLEINDKHDFVCYNAMASHLSLRSNIIYKMITM